MSNPNRNISAAARAPAHVKLKWISIAVLAAGLITGAAIYVIAPQDPDSALHDEVAGAQVYAVAPGQYKFSQSQAMREGGKFAVASSQLDDWFAGLWQGKQLGITLAVLSIAIAGVCTFFSYVLSFQPAAGSGDSSSGN